MEDSALTSHPNMTSFTSSPPRQTSNATTNATSQIPKNPKPKQTKSRNGCVTCKAKRLKCDEVKPSCQQCHKRKVTCGGYKKDFKWKAFQETVVGNKGSPAQAWATSTPIQYNAPYPSPMPEPTPDLPTQHQIESSHTPANASFIQTPTLTNYEPESFDNPSRVVPTYSYGEESSQLGREDAAMKGLRTPYDDVYPSPPSPRPSFSGQSPRLIDLLLPGSVLNATPGSVRIEPVSMLSPPLSSPSTSSFDNGFDVEDVEEVIREPAVADAWGVNTISVPHHYNFYKQPELQPGSPEMLLMRFDKQTCGILSVKDGPTENPWRTLIWPLARNSPALYHAIASLTAFHGTKKAPCLRIKGVEHMRSSIQSLAAGIGEMRTDTALATTLTLAFSESWDQHIATGIEHLRGAKVLIKQAVAAHKRNPLQGDDLARLRFLCSTFVYMTVIARLTSIDDDEVDGEIFDSLEATSLFNAKTEIDPLMGCASSLFPLVGRAANLCRNVRKTVYNSFHDTSQARVLKNDLEQWLPPPESAVECAEDDTSEVRHALQTAEAYRFATLLYLHQAFPEIESLSAAELARKAIDHLQAVPPSSRLIIVQIYPLLAAGCEASSAEDRLWVAQRWQSMASRMWIGNIDRCWEVVQEVWTRREAWASRVNHSTAESAGFKRDLESYLVDEDLQMPHGGIQRGKKQRRDSGSNFTAEESRSSSSTLHRELTVHGKLHWVGVMKDWDWEILLG